MMLPQREKTEARMAYDFKREFCGLYQPKSRPSLVNVPAMTFAAVAGL